MKWLLVVVSIIGYDPQGNKDMWVVAQYFNTEKECVISGAESNIALLARAHREFEYYEKYPGVQPWDAWKAYCVDEKKFKEMMIPPRKDLGA